MTRNIRGIARRRSRLAAAAKVAKDANRPGSPPIGARLAAIPRMVLASATGRYPGLSRFKLALLGVGAAYIVSPIDAVPELVLLVAGVADDIALAVVMAGVLFAETDNFLAWEQARMAPPTIDGHAYR